MRVRALPESTGILLVAKHHSPCMPEAVTGNNARRIGRARQTKTCKPANINNIVSLALQLSEAPAGTLQCSMKGIGSRNRL
jgi:hypothetical protein